jgi:hypothetical protein
MNDDALIRSTQEVRDRLGAEVYVLLPATRRYFLGEALMIGIAGTMLTAFLKGLSAAAEGRVEAWGERVGTWLLDRIAAVVDRGEKPAAELAVAAVAAKDGQTDDDEVVAVLLTKALLDNGMSATDAAKVVGAVRTGVQQIRAS